MSYWHDESTPMPAPRPSRFPQRTSHNPCDWTNPAPIQTRAMLKGYVAPGERLRRIAAALDAEFDERAARKVADTIVQQAAWWKRAAQNLRQAQRRRAERITESELTHANDELKAARREKLRQLYAQEYEEYGQTHGTYCSHRSLAPML